MGRRENDHTVYGASGSVAYYILWFGDGSGG
jgi:hypothetical protein